MVDVDFFFGLGSRYSYLAFSQIDRIEMAYRCRFILHPLSSAEMLEIRGKSPFLGSPQSGQYEKAYRDKDALAWAEYYGVPFVEPKPLPEDHRLMARACYAAELQGALRPYCKAMFLAIFASNESIDVQRCVRIASGLGIDTNRLKVDLCSDGIDRRVTAASRQAIEAGAFGVPTMFAKKRMFWGNDRLVLLEHHLAKQVER
jgi:2-hydroxychromene-2-carboxylate isomerase